MKKLIQHHLKINESYVGDAKVIAISDLHISKNFDFQILDQLVSMVRIDRFPNEPQELFVVIAGDLLDDASLESNKEVSANTLKFLCQLSSIPNTHVMLSLGNHDHLKQEIGSKGKKIWMPAEEESRRFFSQANDIPNVHVLDQKMVTIGKHTFIGFDPTAPYYLSLLGRTNVELRKELYLKESENYVDHLMRSIPEGNYVYYITHDPSFVSYVIESIPSFQSHPMVVISGHNHNGMLPETLAFQPILGTRGLAGANRIFPQYTHGMTQIAHENGITLHIISGGITKISESHGALQKLNLYAGAVIHITSDRDAKKLVLK